MSGPLWQGPPGRGPGQQVDTLPLLPRRRDARATDPLDELASRLEELIAAAVHPDEIAAILESDGMTDDHIRLTYGREDSFALAEELYARIPRRFPEPPGPPVDPWHVGLLGCLLRGLVFALPGLAYVLGAPLLKGAGLAPLLAGALTGWVWNQALSHRAYSWLGLGDREAAARALLAGAPAGALLGSAVAAAAAGMSSGPGQWPAAAFAAAQALYLSAATVLLVLDRERALLCALLPMTAGALLVLPYDLSGPVRTGLLVVSLSLAVVLAAWVLAEPRRRGHAGLRWSRNRDGLRGPGTDAARPTRPLGSGAAVAGDGPGRRPASWGRSDDATVAGGGGGRPPASWGRSDDAAVADGGPAGPQESWDGRVTRPLASGSGGRVRPAASWGRRDTQDGGAASDSPGPRWGSAPDPASQSPARLEFPAWAGNSACPAIEDTAEGRTGVWGRSPQLREGAWWGTSLAQRATRRAERVLGRQVRHERLPARPPGRDARAAPRIAASVPYGLFGLGTGALVLYTALGDVLAGGAGAVVSAPSAVALTLSMGPAEWLLHRFRGESLAGLRASTSPRDFWRGAAAVLAECLAGYLAVLFVLALTGTLLWPDAPALGGMRLATLLLIGTVLWTGLLLQSFGAVIGAAAVCCAAAFAQTMALVTGAGSPQLVGLGVAAVSAALLAGLISVLLGRATAHRV